ncbi:MAG: hypothetical protein Tsb0020_44330 [Haliangiales bacterium]
MTRAPGTSKGAPARLDGAVASALERECRRVYSRYVIEVVEAFNLCPWAKRARLDGRVRPEVMLDQEPTPGQILARIEQAFVAPEGAVRVDIVLILLPRLLWDRRSFHHFVERVRTGHAEIHRHRERGGPPTWAMADFHPDAEPDTQNANRLVAFLRRSPDPTIQVVRRQALDEVRGEEQQGTVFASPDMLNLADLGKLPPSPEPLHERVAAANLSTVERVGVERVAAVLDAIRADRDRAYTCVLGSA